MFGKSFRILLAVLVTFLVLTAGGCTINRHDSPVQDISGHFFSKDIGCSIYFIWHPPYENRGLKKYLAPLNELYCIKPNGELRRLYVPRPKSEPKDLVLADYGYPILIKEELGKVAILDAGGDEREIAEFDDFIELIGVSQDGEKCSISVTRHDKEKEYWLFLTSLDVNSGQVLSEAKLSAGILDLFFKGSDNNMQNFLVFNEEREGSYSKESRTWWEPYICAMGKEGLHELKPLEFPGGRIHGLHEIDIVSDDGRIIGVHNDGSNARFYQSHFPYSEFELLAEMEIEPVSIDSVNRDGSRLILSWLADDELEHFGIWEPGTGRIEEFHVEEQQSCYSFAHLSPTGDRAVIITDFQRGYGEKKRYTIFVYDSNLGELIEAVEWPFGGSIYNSKVGY